VGCHSRGLAGWAGRLGGLTNGTGWAEIGPLKPTWVLDLTNQVLFSGCVFGMISYDLQRKFLENVPLDCKRLDKINPPVVPCILKRKGPLPALKSDTSSVQILINLRQPSCREATTSLFFRSEVVPLRFSYEKNSQNILV
jgi:hypothetical protein